MDKKIVHGFFVYYIANDAALEALQWRLGGIDCILFPKGGPDDPDGSSSTPGNIPAKSEISAFERFSKRAFDIILSGVLLIVFSPLILICALAVFLEDGSPVIYSQERIGLGGHPFHILKFRSMRRDAEAMGIPQLYAGDDDPRLTHVGKFLRQHHLDELPQLWNVFRGDMSFIGYRPERQFYIDRIMEKNPRYRYLYQIRPGVTSYATLYNGYTDTLEKMLTRLDLDLYYLRNHSVWFDFRVLGLTFLSIVSGKKF
ncbi:MAG: sugar transferase [Bacteroidales bacterium]|nr:sugar transferase [Bacteroidales bacterium]